MNVNMLEFAWGHVEHRLMKPKCTFTHIKIYTMSVQEHST